MLAEAVIEHFFNRGAALRYISLFVLGSLAALALPPFYIFPVLLISFPVFYWCLRQKYLPNIFLSTFFFALGYFVCGLYWITNALLVEPGTFAWLLPVALFGLPAILSLFPALLVWAGGMSRTTNGG
jgi:apolipoprotein N-acyltransferase